VKGPAVDLAVSEFPDINSPALGAELLCNREKVFLDLASA